MPESGKSRGGIDLDFPPVSQPKRTPKGEEDGGFVATSFKLENLATPLLNVLVRP